MAKLKENLSELLENALGKVTERTSLPVEKLGKEKHADDLCAHFVWKDGEKSVFLIERFMRLKLEEAMAIRWHMGGFDDNSGYAISQAYENLVGIGNHVVVGEDIAVR